VAMKVTPLLLRDLEGNAANVSSRAFLLPPGSLSWASSTPRANGRRQMVDLVRVLTSFYAVPPGRAACMCGPWTLNCRLRITRAVQNRSDVPRPLRFVRICDLQKSIFAMISSLFELSPLKHVTPFALGQRIPSPGRYHQFRFASSRLPNSALLVPFSI